MTALFVLATILTLLITIAISQTSSAFLGVLLGTRVQEVSVGFGPSIWYCTIRGIRFNLGLIPFGGYTRFLNEDTDDGESQDLLEDEVPFQKLPIISRVGIILSGPLVFLGIGFLFLALAQSLPDSEVVIASNSAFPIEPRAVPDLSVKPQQATTASQITLLFSTILKFFWLAISMQSLQGWGGLLGLTATCGGAGAVSTGAWFTCLGVIIFGFGVINLFPIPVYNGGHLLLLAWEGLRGEMPERGRIILMYAGLALTLVLIARVVYADFLWLTSRN